MTHDRTEALTIRRQAAMMATTHQSVVGWRRQGMPHTWPDCMRWREAQLREQGRREVSPTDESEARARKLAAEAALAEIELARARGEVVPVADVERELGQVLDGLRARVLALPGKYAPRLGLPIAQAQARLEEIGRELMAELAETADDIPDDERDR
jgi:hypothetical protein